MSAAQWGASGPLLLTALFTALMAPIGELLVTFRLKDVVDRNVVVYTIDLFSTATLGALLPLLGAILFLTKAATNGTLVAVVLLVAFLSNFIAFALVLTTDDLHKYVVERRLGPWSYPTWITLVALVGGAIVARALT